MPKYKIRVPEAGTYLHGDGPESVVADSIEEARELLEEFEVHSSIGRCQILYKAQVDDGDCFEGAEPGDTQVWYCHDDGSELAENECRVWHPGPPPLRDWRIEPVGPEPIDFAALPIGTRFTLERAATEDLRLVEQPRQVGDVWEVEVEPVPRPGWPDDEAIGARRTERIAKGGFIYLAPYANNFHPPFRYRLTVQGEAAEGSQDEMNSLLRWVEAEMAEQWRHDLYAAEATRG